MSPFTLSITIDNLSNNVSRAFSINCKAVQYSATLKVLDNFENRTIAHLKGFHLENNYSSKEIFSSNLYMRSTNRSLPKLELHFKSCQYDYPGTLGTKKKNVIERIALGKLHWNGDTLEINHDYFLKEY